MSATSAPHAPLLQTRAVRRLIAGWTITYALGSWMLEWGYSQVGHRQPMDFLEGSKGAIYAAVWAPLLVLAVWLSDRWPIRSATDGGRFALHSTAAMLAPFAWGTVAYELCVAWVPGWTPWGVGRMYLNTANGVLYVYAVIVIICHVAQRVRANREREVSTLLAAEAATRSQLQVLAMELQPHFLFNALHSVSSLLHTDRVAAVEALRELRDMLHSAVRTASVAEVSLTDELESVRMYTRIQERRFGRRLHLDWQIAEEAYDAVVPHFLLQPLVENAIKYSVEALSGERHVVVAAARIGRELVVRVSDDGLAPNATSNVPLSRQSRRGLANARERLAHLYGAGQSLTLEPGIDGRGAIAEVRFPFREMNNQSQTAVPTIPQLR